MATAIRADCIAASGPAGARNTHGDSRQLSTYKNYLHARRFAPTSQRGTLRYQLLPRRFAPTINTQELIYTHGDSRTTAIRANYQHASTINTHGDSRLSRPIDCQLVPKRLHPLQRCTPLLSNGGRRRRLPIVVVKLAGGIGRLLRRRGDVRTHF